MINFSDKFVSEDLRTAASSLNDPAVKHLGQIQNGTCSGADFLGWYDYPKNQGFAEAEKIKNFASELEVEYDLVLVIGIGGSYLGTRAVSDALSHKFLGQVASRHTPISYCGHHLSESELVETMDLLAGKLPVVTVISKSGTTTEPGIAFRIIRSYMEERFGIDEARRRIVAITDPEKGALRQLASEEGYVTFDIPSNVGGRFSVLSPVGLVPLCLAGYDIDEFCKGAHSLFLSLSECEDLKSHPAIRYASSRYAAYQAGKKIELLAYYEPKLNMLVEWWRQLFGESEGKEGKGIFPAGLAYTTDLHSLGQMAQEGERNLFETFLVFDEVVSSVKDGVERRMRVPQVRDNHDKLGYLETRFVDDINKAAVKGTKIAHFDGGVPCFEIRMNRLCEFSLGELMSFFEVACAIGGGLLEVNAFDQPGVEEYKKNLFGLLGKPGFEAMGEELRKRF